MGRQSHEEQNRIMGSGSSQGPRAGCTTLGRPLKTSLQNSLFMKWGPECLPLEAAVKSQGADVGKAPQVVSGTVPMLLRDFPFLFPL